MFKRFRAEVDRTFSSWRKETATKSVAEVARIPKSVEQILARFNELSAARTTQRNREIARRS